MLVKRVIQDIKVMFWNELSEERKKQELDKAIKKDEFYQEFADDMWRNYQEDLEYLQDKYKVNIAPEFSQGSQHFIVKFVCEDIKGNQTALWYKDTQFDVQIDSRKNIQIFIDTDNSLDKEYYRLVNELEQVIKAFLFDFYAMYKHYEEHFMYGHCDLYEEYLKYQLEYSDFEYEEIISEKTIELERK